MEFVKKLLKQGLTDVTFQMDRATVSVSKIARLHKNFPCIPHVLPSSFENLQRLRDRMVFSEAQLNLMPSDDLKASFKTCQILNVSVVVT